VRGGGGYDVDREQRRTKVGNVRGRDNNYYSRQAAEKKIVTSGGARGLLICVYSNIIL
jgi:hypothetical protein